MGDPGIAMRAKEDDSPPEYPLNIDEAPLRGWDSQIFAQELVKHNIAPRTTNLARDGVPTETQRPTGGFDRGTWEGTQLALSEMYGRIEKAYRTFFEASGFETSIPLTVVNRNELYQWASGKYPPHLALVPKNREVSQTELFNRLGLVEAAIMLQKIVPKNFIGRVSEGLLEKFKALLFGENYEGATFAALERNNSDLFRRHTATDIMQGKNIGDHPDWWSDAKFAQQFLTGTNPTTVKHAGSLWIDRFRKAAEVQGEPGQAVADLLRADNADSFYVQDYSYFREAAHYGESGTFAEDAPMKAGTGGETKYCAAPVVLFRLPESGQLHPIAIVLDYKIDMAHSVTIFNKRLEAVDPNSTKAPEQLEAEKNDWPWRYAKQVVQMADWCLHEVIVHLTWTHLVEEATIVAANRAFEVTHPVFRLLEPHWYRTLPINAGARATLVPTIIFDLIGMSDEQPYNFIKYHYAKFDWTKRYIPADLESRGFPPKDLESKPKYKNYAYGRNMILMWDCIRAFVEEMLAVHYPHDSSVAEDEQIKAWYIECQQNGQITGFPAIKTREELFDACTMAIHIASPQHTAVNYLQNFYQAFVPNKPPALYRPLPTSLSELQNYIQRDVLLALPVNHQRDWLLAVQIPWLLSFKTAKESSLIEYAVCLYNLVRHSEDATDQRTKAIASRFYGKLLELGKVFQRHSNEMTKGTIPYTVMDPGATAVSILI